MGPLIPLSILLGGLHVLSDGKLLDLTQKELKGRPPPRVPSPEEIARMSTQIRAIPGGTARYFNPDVSQKILATWQHAALAPVPQERGDEPAYGPFYQLVRLDQYGASRAIDAAQQIYASEMVVCASLSNAVVTDKPKFVLFITPERRRLITSTGQWAIVWDGSPAGAAIPAVRRAQPPNPFPGMSPEMLNQLKVLYGSGDVQKLRETAAALLTLGQPLASRMLTDRADALAGSVTPTVASATAAAPAVAGAPLTKLNPAAAFLAEGDELEVIANEGIEPQVTANGTPKAPRSKPAVKPQGDAAT